MMKSVDRLSSPVESSGQSWQPSRPGGFLIIDDNYHYDDDDDDDYDYDDDDHYDDGDEDHDDDDVDVEDIGNPGGFLIKRMQMMIISTVRCS